MPRTTGQSLPESSPTPDREESFNQLVLVQRQIPRHVITDTWEQLPTPAINRIEEILSIAEGSVTMSLQDERKRAHAGTAIRLVTRKLRRKLERGLPFPIAAKGQRDQDFDFEHILDDARSLNAQLTPALHSIGLLQAEIKKEEKLLAEEEEALATLQANAKAEQQKRRAETKTLHPVLKHIDGESLAGHTEASGGNAETHGGLSEDFKVSSLMQQINALLTEVQNDTIAPELQSVTKELRNHIDSIQGNLGQIEDVLVTLDTTEAQIRGVLAREFDAAVNEQIVSTRI
jgi:kinetochore protein Fta7